MARGLRQLFPWVRLIASMREPIRCGRQGWGAVQAAAWRRQRYAARTAGAVQACRRSTRWPCRCHQRALGPSHPARSRYLWMLGHNLDRSTYTCLAKRPDLFSCLEAELPLNNYTAPFTAWLDAGYPPEQILLLQVRAQG